MKKFLLLILALVLVACQAQTKAFIGSSWRVTSLENDGKVVAVTNEVMLTVKSASEFTLSLDKNNCFGTYVITDANEIQLKTLGCTELCCDSEFSTEVTQALYKVSSIDFKKETVTLTGSNVTINFKKHSEAKNNIKMMHQNDHIVGKQEKISTEATTPIGRIENPNKTTDEVTLKGIGDFITLYKSPCKGSCEEFTMTFYENGVVDYNGKFNASVQGKRSMVMVKDSITTLFKAFQQENFGEFAENYDNPRIMDAQSVQLTYQGKIITIRFKPSAPQNLQHLLSLIENEAENVLKHIKK